MYAEKQHSTGINPDCPHGGVHKRGIVIEYVDKELGPIEIGMNNYPYQLTPAEVEEMIQTLKKYHFNVEALIEDMRNKEKENSDN